MHAFPSLHTQTSDSDSAAVTSPRLFLRFFQAFVAELPMPMLDVSDLWHF